MEGKIIKKLLEHDERLDSIEEQLAFLRENAVTKDEYLCGQDKIMVILKRLDEERLVTHHTLQKLTELVERHEIKLFAR